MTDSNKAWITNFYATATVTMSGGSTMTVNSNTATVLTGTSWTGGTPVSGETYTLSGVTATSSDPQVLVLGARVFSEPSVAGEFDIVIDTGAEYEGDEPQATQEAKDQRDALQALVNATAVSVTDPWGNSLTLRFLDVSDLKVVGPDEDGKIHYVIQCRAEERTTP